MYRDPGSRSASRAPGAPVRTRSGRGRVARPRGRRGARADRRPGPTRAPGSAGVLSGRSKRSAPARRRAAPSPSGRRGRCRYGITTVDSTASSVAIDSSASKNVCASGSSNASSAAPSSARARSGSKAVTPVCGVRGLRGRLPGPRGRFPGRKPLIHVPLHRADALQVARRVQPQPTRRPLRPQQAVPPLPRAQELRAHARATTELTDPQVGVVFHVRNHTRLIQDLDRAATAPLPSAPSSWTKPIQEVDSS